jgi:nucleoside phosphorylase
VINLLVALGCEAAPLVETFGLSAKGGHPFRLWSGDGIRLVVSGMGKARAAAAVGWLHGHVGGRPHEAWLNAGIAGHGDAAFATLLLAHRVTDRASGRSWYPPLLFEPPCPTCECVSVDRPENGYPEPTLYDMEASAFLEAARRFSPAEVVQVVKVVSDTPDHPADGLDRTAISTLVEARADGIAAVADRLRELTELLERRTAGDEDRVRAITARWHFSASREHRLRRVLRAWRLRSTGEPPAVDELADCRDAAELMARLEAGVEKLPLLPTGTAP